MRWKEEGPGEDLGSDGEMKSDQLTIPILVTN